jgi:RHS repeat-associated protein
MMVDDGTSAYLQDDGALASIDGSSDASYLLGDALGSVRGATDDAGSLTESADYNVFGSLRTGDALPLGYAGEQSDPSTGLMYLRARYLNSDSGRFISADTVQPNAPGTQGYNPYAYVGNSPTTWNDPSGHVVEAPPDVDTMFESIQVLLNQARAAYAYDVACAETVGGCAGIVATGWGLITQGNVRSVLTGFALAAAFAPLICVFESVAEMGLDGHIGWGGCLGKALKYMRVVAEYAPPITAPAPETQPARDSQPGSDPSPDPFSPPDPAPIPTAPTPSGGVCNVDQVGVEIPPARMAHILEEHGPASTSFRGQSPKGRFSHGESGIRNIVRHAIVLGYGKWQVSGSRCILNQALPYTNIGKDNANVPTSCVHVVTEGLTRPFSVWTAYPYPQAGCLP